MQEYLKTVDVVLDSINTLKSYQLFRGEVMVHHPTKDEIDAHNKTKSSILFAGKPEAGVVDEMLLTVVAVGDKVEGIIPGDKVFVRGTLQSMKIAGCLVGITHENNIIAKLK